MDGGAHYLTVVWWDISVLIVILCEIYWCVCSYRMVFWFPFPITGTGSGIGTKVLETLRDEYPEVYK